MNLEVSCAAPNRRVAARVYFVLRGFRRLRHVMTLPWGGVPANPNIDQKRRPPAVQAPQIRYTSSSSFIKSMAAQKINEAHEHIAKAEKWWVVTQNVSLSLRKQQFVVLLVLACYKGQRCILTYRWTLCHSPLQRSWRLTSLVVVVVSFWSLTVIVKKWLEHSDLLDSAVYSLPVIISLVA